MSLTFLLSNHRPFLLPSSTIFYCLALNKVKEMLCCVLDLLTSKTRKICYVCNWLLSQSESTKDTLMALVTTADDLFLSPNRFHLSCPSSFKVPFSYINTMSSLISCREVCADRIMNHHAGRIGGPGMTVDDESKFGKTKFNRGRYIEGQWVFGGICRQRDKDTLLPIIRTHILPGTCMMSDMWKVYDYLKDEGYRHVFLLLIRENLHPCLKSFQTRTWFQLVFHWVSKPIHLTRIRCSGWVRAAWIINEFEN